MYSTTKGETWESVAADNGLSVEELRGANPDVTRKKLKKGTLLIIPRRAVQTIPSIDTSAPAEPVARTSIPNLKVGVLLPLSDAKMLEFYRGFLMAADSVRLSGVNLDIHAWDCGSSVSRIEDLTQNLRGLDIVFGPASPTQIPVVADYCREAGIRLVLPFHDGLNYQEHPLVYHATAPAPVVYEAAAKGLLDYYDNKNFVIVRSGNPDAVGRMLSTSLTQQLSQLGIIPRTLELGGDDFAYESAFNQFRSNVIVLDDSSVRSLNILVARLNDFRQKHSGYHLSLVGYPAWRDESQRLLNDFFALDTYILSPSYYNVLDQRTQNFQRTYEKNFRATIIQGSPRYAALGFDLGYFFMRGLSQLGDTFDQKQGDIPQEPYQNRFHFQRNASGMGFTNHFVQFIHYTNDNMIELIR
ncbi:MAG: amino acid ABC transporter substrate-binding protein [Prevotella sp.]